MIGAGVVLGSGKVVWCGVGWCVVVWWVSTVWYGMGWGVSKEVNGLVRKFVSK